STKSDAELVKLQLQPNDWYVRHARRLLAERAAAGKLDPAAHAQLAEIAFRHPDEPRRLRGLWALHVTGGLGEEQVRKGLGDAGPYGRAWTIQLAVEDGKASPALVERLTQLAQKDPSPVVRLYLASAAQRLPLDQRWPLVGSLTNHASQDASDHNLPLMIWYA